ncbi:hypothetical protein I4I73_10280 [Pseudonocardia sp. KRD-184]|uniref:Uncharacterized protein n=1 Tax=Pseudonocardia oceani TaxID=2792013 RepID=A0ABS6UGV1_9PSEU|nr:hypothetical protein [Pseudonocardia oceani]MBW0088774.1 hypothetical protein [Pseudonocardia oceani]MBW0096373.1 hypothetical protein [Pseudonocardia oceani]MBW0107344.1 hypothetical protein [Pseudonocardia oceani]MBW0122441.1 hypothetical protein [Pseudonocardia oceani]MBW0131476.1 hypothetical protein [Pseudonocardia oceani]
MTTLPGDDRGQQPFWAHAEIDGTALDVVTALVLALATRWVSDDLADRFGHSVATAAATVVMGGDGTFDLWEEPGRLVCHVARRGAPDAIGLQPDPRRLRLVTRAVGPGRPEPGSGIVVERSPGRVTLILPVPFE